MKELKSTGGDQAICSHRDKIHGTIDVQWRESKLKIWVSRLKVAYGVWLRDSMVRNQRPKSKDFQAHGP